MNTEKGISIYDKHGVSNIDNLLYPKEDLTFDDIDFVYGDTPNYSKVAEDFNDDDEDIMLYESPEDEADNEKLYAHEDKKYKPEDLII